MNNSSAKRRVQPGPWAIVDTAKRLKGQPSSDEHVTPYMQAQPLVDGSHTVRTETTTPGFIRSVWSSTGEELLVRYKSEPLPRGSPPVPKRTVSMPSSSLVESLAPANRPMPVLSMPISPTLAPSRVAPTFQRQLPHPLHTSIPTTASPVESYDTPSLDSPSASAFSLSSPVSSSHIAGQFVASSDQLARFATRTVCSGRHGEWNDEKKDVLAAYFLGKSFPNMKQREALGRQVGLETLQVSKFFSRTRSEVKYSRTTLKDLALQASYGLRFSDTDQPASLSPINLDATDTTSAEDKSFSVSRRGRGRGVVEGVVVVAAAAVAGDAVVVELDEFLGMTFGLKIAFQGLRVRPRCPTLTPLLNRLLPSRFASKKLLAA
ncbi:homeobox domain protein [Ceratobasidium sp. AG-Ba]|nr:homeobox domain protein [Ceratobasidium sp. AG-Ba]